MSGTFSVELDPAHGLMVLTLTGFFELEDVAEFARAREVAARALGTAPNRHISLCDVSGCKIQSQVVIEAFNTVLADPRWAAARVAFVTGVTAARMQVRRLANSPRLAFFQTRADAERWLLDDQMAA